MLKTTLLITVTFLLMYLLFVQHATQTNHNQQILNQDSCRSVFDYDDNCCEHICASYYCKICCSPQEKPSCTKYGCRCNKKKLFI